MSELAQKSGSKHRKDILRDRDSTDLRDEDIDQGDARPARCEPPAADRDSSHRQFWIKTSRGPQVMAWDRGEQYWEVHGDNNAVLPEDAARLGWTFLKRAEYT